jgi:hypothetical protein
MKARAISRRGFLRSSGVALALPLLDRMGLAASSAAARAVVPRRMVCIMTPLGVDHACLYPQETGRIATLPPYLEVLKDVRDDLTVISGVSHPDVNDGHMSQSSFMTGAPHPSYPGFRNTISLDQLAAEHIGSQTRFPSLVLNLGGSFSISWTRNGVQLPAESKPSQVFARLFMDGSPEEVRTQVRRLREGHSIMDAVLEQANSLQARLGPRDRQKLDEYFTSVREVEQRLVSGQEWAKKPKPQAPPLRDTTDCKDVISWMRVWCDLIHLAFQTDSTRLITFYITETAGVKSIPGVKHDWHGLSHTLSIPENRAEIRIIEKGMFNALGDLLGKLQGTAEGSETLLDRTMVLFGSNLHDGGHGNKNLPVLVAGGGFRHGMHLAFDQNKNMPLCRLYVSMLQRLGLEIDSFASGKGTIPGLEMK